MELEGQRKRSMLAVILMHTQRAIPKLEMVNSSSNEWLLMGFVAKPERRSKVPRIENYAELTVPQQSLDDFKSLFRQSRVTFEVFVIELQRCQELQLGEQGYGRAPITVPKQAMVFLWYVGTPELFRS